MVASRHVYCLFGGKNNIIENNNNAAYITKQYLKYIRIFFLIILNFTISQCKEAHTCENIFTQAGHIDTYACSLVQVLF